MWDVIDELVKLFESCQLTAKGVPPDATIVPGLLDGRAETGVLQFRGDWPGVFIRGDNAKMMLLQLQEIQERIDE